MTAIETTGERKRVQWPADYYSSATPPPVLPRWATLGCGAAALLVLVIIFVGGALLAGGGLTQVVDLSLGFSVAEMKGMYAAEVSPTRRQSLEREVEGMRESLRSGRVSVTSLQPFLQTLRSSVADGKVTSMEASALESSARKINAVAKR